MLQYCVGHSLHETEDHNVGIVTILFNINMWTALHLHTVCMNDDYDIGMDTATQ